MTAGLTMFDPADVSRPTARSVSSLLVQDPDLHPTEAHMQRLGKAHPRRTYGLAAAGAATLAVSVLAQSGQPAAPSLPPPFATPPAINFPKVIGWPAGTMPKAPAGFRVDLFASNLESPRWIYVLPNNDVLVAQSRTENLAGIEPKLLEGLREAGSVGPSPNQITLLRDGNGDGTFEIRRVFLSS